MALLRRLGDPQAATRAAMASHPMDSGAEPSRPFEDAVRRQSHGVARALGQAKSGHALDLITREAFVAYLALARAHGETYYIGRYEQQLALVQTALREWSVTHPAPATSGGSAGREPGGAGPNWGALVLTLVLGGGLLAGLAWAGSSSSDLAGPASADVSAAGPVALTAKAWGQLAAPQWDRSRAAVGALREAVLSKDGDSSAAFVACQDMVAQAPKTAAVPDPADLSLASSWRALTTANAVISRDCEGILAPQFYMSPDFVQHLVKFIQVDATFSKELTALLEAAPGVG